MKILHVNDYSHKGGAEVLMHAMMSRLAQHDVQTFLFTADELPHHTRTPWSYIASSRAKRALRQRLRDEQPDVVHLHNYYHVLSPAILSVLAAERCRVVMTAHDFHLVCPNSGMFRHRGPMIEPVDPAQLRSMWRTLFTRWDHRGLSYCALKIAQHVWNYRLLGRQRVIDLVLCPSLYMQRVLSDRGFDTLFLPNPVPAERVPIDKPGGPLRLIFAGRIEPEKGLLQFLQFVPQSFEGTIDVVGEGSMLTACTDLCVRRGIDRIVQFHGHLPHDETLQRIANAHLLVLPSRWVENAPMSLIEALAHQTNILVPALGGMQEIVEESGIGYMYRLDDSSSLAATMREINAQHRQGTLNTFDAGQFIAPRTAQQHTATLLRAYQQVLAGRLG